MGVANRDSQANHRARAELKMSGESSSKPSDGYKAAFHSKFPELVRELTEDGLKNPEISDGVQHLKDVRKHTIP